MIGKFQSRFISYLSSPTASGWLLGYARWILGFSLIYFYLDNRLYIIETIPSFPYLNTYDGFHWLAPLPAEFMPWLFNLTIAVTLLFTAGIAYRASSILSTLLFWYFFLLEKGFYNNHYYLFGLLLILFMFVDGRALSLKNLFKRHTIRDQVPNWQILIFRLQLALVYLFGAMAKLDIDWLQGYPMRFWLYDFAHDSLPAGSNIQLFFLSDAGAVAYAYGGLIFDLFVPIMLLVPKLRKWAIPPLLFFHLSNHFMFDIGSFPWTMLALTLIFFDGEKIAAFLWRKEKPLGQLNLSPFRRKFGVWFFSIWMLIQILVPLRQFAFSGHPAWTGQGNWFAWRMMLTDTVEGVSIRIIVPRDNVDFYVTLDSYFDYYQFYKSIRCPMVILKFIDHLKESLRENNALDGAIIKLEMYKGVNFRPPSLFNDTTLNYALVEYEPWKSQDWILPNERKKNEIVFNESFYQNWVEFVRKRAEMKRQQQAAP